MRPAQRYALKVEYGASNMLPAIVNVIQKIHRKIPVLFVQRVVGNKSLRRTLIPFYLLMESVTLLWKSHLLRNTYCTFCSTGAHFAKIHCWDEISLCASVVKSQLIPGNVCIPLWAFCARGWISVLQTLTLYSLL